MSKVGKDSEDEWREVLKKYMEKGMEEKVAEQNVDLQMKEGDMTRFLRKYGTILDQIVQLRKGVLHNEVLSTIDQNIAKEYNNKRSIKLALRQFRESFEDLFETDEEHSGESEVDISDSEDISKQIL